MVFSYGEGEYIQGDMHLKGEILLSEHKLYLRDRQQELSQTFVPLEKIKKVRRDADGLELDVELSIMIQYTARLRGAKKQMADLCKDLVRARGLKKRFLRREWYENL